LVRPIREGETHLSVNCRRGGKKIKQFFEIGDIIEQGRKEGEKRLL